MRQKLIVAMIEHDPREVHHECLCLNIELPDNLVAEPTSNQIDDFYL